MKKKDFSKFKIMLKFYMKDFNPVSIRLLKIFMLLVFVTSEPEHGGEVSANDALLSVLKSAKDESLIPALNNDLTRPLLLGIILTFTIFIIPPTLHPSNVGGHIPMAFYRS